MNKETALNFLKENQPMPDDSNLDKSVIAMYDDVIKYFLYNPDKECLPLLLNSFGEYDGYGVYQSVEDVILRFEHEEVVDCLVESLNSRHNGVKYWCAQISALFPDKKLISPLKNLLKDTNNDIREAAITSLAQIEDDEILDILKSHLDTEKDIEIISLIYEIISVMNFLGK